MGESGPIREFDPAQGDPAPTLELVRRPASWAKIGPNARQDYGDESKLRALARSRAKRQIMPLLAKRDGTCLDGNRTLIGLGLEGLLDTELDFLITNEEPPPDQVLEWQANSAIHRADLSDYEKAVVMRDILAARPSLTRAQLATILEIDKGEVTKYLSLFVCSPEIQEAARDGEFGVSVWYPMSGADNQLELLALKRTGVTRDGIVKATRKKPSTPAVRTAKIKCPLPSGQVVTVSGSEISLEDAIEVLGEAAKAMRDAVKKGLTAKTFASAMRDMASAGV
jgi:ParB family transcriptional regulator, chromosome partitioning protein